MKRFRSFILENVPMPKRSDSATDAEHSAKLKAWAAKERGEAIEQTEKAASTAKTLDTTIKGLKATETVLDAGLYGASYVVPGGAAVYGGLQVAKAGLDASRGDYQSAQDRLIDAGSSYVGGKVAVGSAKHLTKAGFGSFTSSIGGSIIGQEVSDRLKSDVASVVANPQPQPTLNTTPSQSSPIKATQTSTPSAAAAKNQSATSTSTSATSATSVTNAPTIENERISSTSAPLDATVTGSIKLSRQANQYATSGPAGTGRNQSWKPGARMVAETWQEYNWKFGEDRKRAKQVLKKIRKHFNLPETMPGDE